MKPKPPLSWQEASKDGNDGSSKPKEGLALLLDNAAGKQTPVMHLATMAIMSDGSADLRHGQDSTREVLQRCMAYVLDASFSLTGPNAYPFVRDGSVELEAIELYLKQRLDVLCTDGAGQPPVTHEDLVTAGKVGPPIVQMQRGSTSGEIKFDSTSLSLESLSNFSSVRANACVMKGKWMYEVTLGTAGIQQLGWAPLNCPFTNEEGVGDAPDSYAIDGKRIRKWNRGSRPYGQPWMPGDVIGCCIDLDEGKITFHRNGTSLGVAFTGVRRLQEGLGYFPALSLSHGECCELNFGGRSFAYPVDGYLPFHAPPLVSRTEEDQAFENVAMDFDPPDRTKRQDASDVARYLLGCLHRLAVLETEGLGSVVLPGEYRDSPVSLSKDTQVLVASVVCDHLGPLLLAGGQPSLTNRSFGRREEARPRGGYVVRGCLLPFLLETLGSRPQHDLETLEQVLDLLLVCLDQHELEGVVPVLMEGLAYNCRIAGYQSQHPIFSGPYPHLTLACRLVRRKEVLQIWWASQTFENSLEGLLTRKSPNKNDLEELFPVVWWPGCQEDACSEGQMAHVTQSLATAISKVEELQVDLCRQLLVFVPPRPQVPSIGVTSPSLAQGGVFGAFLQSLVRKNRGANRNVPPPGLSDNSVLVSAFFVLLRMLLEGLNSPSLSEEDRTLEWTERKGLGYFHSRGQRTYPVKLFLRSDPLYSDLPRLGGTFSHLSKASPIGFPQDYAEIVWEEESDDEDVLSDRCMTPGHDQESVLFPGEVGHVSQSGTSAASGPAEVTSRRIWGAAQAGDRDWRSGSGRSLSEGDAVQGGGGGWLDGGLGSNGSRETHSGDGWDGASRARREPSPHREQVPREEELVDILVLLYHLGLASNFKQASLCLQNQMQAISLLQDCDQQIRASEGRDELGQHLRETRSVYREDVCDNVRNCTWYRVSLFAKWKQEGIYCTCAWIVQLLLASSKRGVLFSYVPEFYVETLVDSFHALRRSDPPFAPPASLLRRGLSSLVTFLVAHFNDSRIANPDTRDLLLQSISVLLQYREYVAAFESNRTARDKLPAALLTAFDNRFWIPVSHILLRLCKGSAFGGARSSAHAQNGGECSSPVFQELLRKKCEDDPALLGAFVNRLFNTLNWTITEFSATVKEMQDQLERRQVPELQQRKCSIMFELSCNLLRILEFLAGQLPHVFLQGPEMNLTRLSELLLFVLNHTTTGPDACLFDSALRMLLVPPEKLRREAILGPLVGILINLGGGEPRPGMQWDIARTLAHVDPSPQCLANFDYLVNYNWSGTFRGDHSLLRLPQLRMLVKRVRSEVEAIQQEAQQKAARKRSEAEGEQKDLEDDAEGNTCSICYANEIDTTFLPCKHTSCRQCISRHLLNNSRCFFCNAVVEALQPPAPEAGDNRALEKIAPSKSPPRTI